MTNRADLAQTAPLKRTMLAIGLVVLVLVCSAFVIRRVVVLEGSTVRSGLLTIEVHKEFASDPRIQKVVMAGAQGRLAELETLVASGADVNQAGDFYRLTPLMWAVIHGRMEGISGLLTMGADPNYRVAKLSEADVYRTFHELHRRDTTLVRGRISSLLRAFSGESALSLALSKGRLDLMELLLRNGADPNIQGRVSPVLFDAVQEGYNINPALVLMLDHGADPNLTEEPEGRGGSALGWFTYIGNLESALLLIERGADPTRTELTPMPGVRAEPRDLTHENATEWNEVASNVQRLLDRGKTRDPHATRLKALMEERGVKFPAYDPRRRWPDEQQPHVSFFELLKFRYMPDQDIERLIDYHTRNNSLHDFGTLAEDFQRYQETQVGHQP